MKKEARAGREQATLKSRMAAAVQPPVVFSPGASPHRSPRHSPRLAKSSPQPGSKSSLDVNKENTDWAPGSSPAPEKKVRKRRHSVFPANQGIFADDEDEDDTDTLRFELENALETNAILTDQVVDARKALAVSKAENAKLRGELSRLKPKVNAQPPASTLGVSARICGHGLLALVAGGPRAPPPPPPPAPPANEVEATVVDEAPVCKPAAKERPSLAKSEDTDAFYSADEDDDGDDHEPPAPPPDEGMPPEVPPAPPAADEAMLAAAHALDDAPPPPPPESDDEEALPPPPPEEEAVSDSKPVSVEVHEVEYSFEEYEAMKKKKKAAASEHMPLAETRARRQSAGAGIARFSPEMSRRQSMGARRESMGARRESMGASQRGETSRQKAAADTKPTRAEGADTSERAPTRKASRSTRKADDDNVTDEPQADVVDEAGVGLVTEAVDAPQQAANFEGGVELVDKTGTPPPPPPPKDVMEVSDGTDCADGAPPPPPETDEDGAPVAKRRSRRKSVVSRECISAARQATLDDPPPTPVPPPKPPPTVAEAVIETAAPPSAVSVSPSVPSAADGESAETGDDDTVAAAPQPASDTEWPLLALGVLPDAAAIGRITDEGGLLAMTLQAALADYTASGDVDDKDGIVWDGIKSLLGKLGGVASALRGRPVGGKQKRTVRFAVHDLSCIEPPKVQRPGSESEQEMCIDQLCELMRAQRAVLPSSDTTADVPRRCLRHVLAALGALSTHASLAADMQRTASFYAGELAHWLVSGEPLLHRRLSELLSSSLRLHLTAIFSEEEGNEEPDPTLAAMLSRVREHAAAFGFTIAVGDDAAEHFAALVSAHLLTLHSYAGLVAAGSPAHAALSALTANAGEDAAASAALHELPADDKAHLLEWAQAHAVLLQVFGPREPLLKLMRAPANKAHFAKLAALAAAVGELSLKDEMYLAPLSDVQALQKRLHAEAGLAKAAHEGLLIFAMGSKRRTARTARGKGK